MDGCSLLLCCVARTLEACKAHANSEMYDNDVASVVCSHMKLHLVTRWDRRQWMCIIKVKGVTVIRIQTQQSSWLVGHILSALMVSDFFCLISSHRPLLSPTPLFFLTRPPFAPQMFSFSPSDSDVKHTQDTSVASASSSLISARSRLLLIIFHCPDQPSD